MSIKALLTSSSLTLTKSVLGKNSRKRPFAFSLLPLCQDEYASAK